MDAPAAHYNGLTVATRKRRALGPAIELKRAHNALKRELVIAHARGASFLVDVACGRGNDMLKWCEAGVLRALGLDASVAQVAEAQRRCESLGLRRYSFERADDCIAALDDLPDGCVDAASCMFALNYFFSTEHEASRLLRAVSRVLRPGGRFFGVCADGTAVEAAIEARRLRTNKVALECAAPWPRRAAQGRGFGLAYSLRIDDTVLRSDDGHAPVVEFAVFAADLDRLASAAGLERMAETRLPEYARISDPDYREASMLYSAFAFRKRPAPPPPASSPRSVLEPLM